MDLMIDPATGDLAIPVQMVTGIDAVRQDLQLTLNFIAGSYALDVTAGIPYFQNVLGKQAGGQKAVDAIFKTAILTRPGVLSLLSYSSTLQSRQYRAVFACNTIYGPTGEITWPA